MSTKLVSSAVIVGLVFGTAASAFAADTPKTKADCGRRRT